MKSMKTLWITLCLGGLCATAGDFVNLTFDEPDLRVLYSLNHNFYPPYIGPASKIIRGWTVTAGGKRVGVATYAPYAFGYSGIVSVVQNPPNVIGGEYAIVLSSVPDLLGPEIRLSQTGRIPEYATGLWLEVAGHVEGYVNGSKIGESEFSHFVDAVWDIRAYQGRDVKLEFYVPPNEYAYIDILGFEGIPEPSTWALLGMGTALLGWQTARRRGQR